MANVGQPTKCTPEIQQKMVESLSIGNFVNAACHQAGITYNAHYNWMLRGKDIVDEETGETTPGEEPFRTYAQAITKAEADAEGALVKVWHDAASTNWQAAKELMARRYKNWAPKETLVQEVNVKGKIEHELILFFFVCLVYSVFICC